MKEKSKENKGNQANGAVYMFDNEVVKTLEKHKDINDISTELLPRYMGRIICETKQLISQGYRNT